MLKLNTKLNAIMNFVSKVDDLEGEMTTTLQALIDADQGVTIGETIDILPSNVRDGYFALVLKHHVNLNLDDALFNRLCEIIVSPMFALVFLVHFEQTVGISTEARNILVNKFTGKRPYAEQEYADGILMPMPMEQVS